MRWEDRRRSSNVRDARGGAGSARMGSGLRIGGGMGLGGILLIVILSLLTGGNPLSFLGGSQNSGTYYGDGTYKESAEEKTRREFLEVVLAETEDTWHAVFKENGRTYREPTLTLFTGAVDTACGSADSAIGPFYCPGDKNVYIDLSFFDELATKFKSPGDFAMAYVLAHEVGHHVQNELGIMDQINQYRTQLSKTEMNQLTVRLELQADYLAGVWAHHAERAQILEAGDIEEAMKATAAVGDDTLQKEAMGYVVPDSFTHGTAAQRSKWFMMGFKAGNLSKWDTFSLDYDQLVALDPLEMDMRAAEAAPVYLRTSRVMQAGSMIGPSSSICEKMWKVS